MPDKTHWEQGAVKHPGSLTKAAKAANKSLSGYCSQSGLSGHREKQCNLMEIFRKQAKNQK